jgi:hypothetical protein
LYNKFFFCPEFDAIYVLLEAGQSPLASSASPLLVFLIGVFATIQLIWIFFPFATIPAIQLILMKLKEKRIKDEVKVNILK